MRTVEILIVGGWALFWIYWLVAALPMKRGRVSWSRELGIRAVLFVVIVVLVRLGAFNDRRIQANPWLAIFGLTLLAVGLGVAVRARRFLTRPAALREVRATAVNRSVQPPLPPMRHGVSGRP